MNDYEIVLKEVEKLRALTTQQIKLSTDLKKDNENKSQEIINLQKDLKYKIELIGQLENCPIWRCFYSMMSLSSLMLLIF